jgi:hypothetical protein
MDAKRSDADCLLLVATYGEADTHYQFWFGILPTIAAVHRMIAERPDLILTRTMGIPRGVTKAEVAADLLPEFWTTRG